MKRSLKPEPDFGVTDARYAAWLAYAFDRPVTENGWYFDLDLGEGFDADSVETVGLIGRTMARSGADLADFSDAQVYYGLNFMTNEIHGQAHCFGDAAVSVDRRVEAVRAFAHLYKNCFEPRCLPRLGHLSEGGENRLNMLAYMLWDTSPIRSLNDHLPPVITAIMDVWDFVLASPNEACIEGALHGLGEAAFKHGEMVRRMIDRFLATTRDAHDAPLRRGSARLRPIRPALRAYAHRARTGMIL